MQLYGRGVVATWDSRLVFVLENVRLHATVRQGGISNMGQKACFCSLKCEATCNCTPEHAKKSAHIQEYSQPCMRIEITQSYTKGHARYFFSHLNKNNF